MRALRIAQRRLRPEVRSKLLSISSARTDGTLVPVAWRFVFSDHATSGDCRIVTVAAKASSEHPDTVEAFSSIKSARTISLQVIPESKLLIDSNQALERVREIFPLDGNLSAVYQLYQSRKDLKTAWQLSFYAYASELISSYRVDSKSGAVQLVENHAKASEHGAHGIH